MFITRLPLKWKRNGNCVNNICWDTIVYLYHRVGTNNENTNNKSYAMIVPITMPSTDDENTSVNAYNDNVNIKSMQTKSIYEREYRYFVDVDAIQSKSSQSHRSQHTDLFRLFVRQTHIYIIFLTTTNLLLLLFLNTCSRTLAYIDETSEKNATAIATIVAMLKKYDINVSTKHHNTFREFWHERKAEKRHYFGFLRTSCDGT